VPHFKAGVLMKIKITDERGNKNEKEIQIEKTSVKDLLEQLKINPLVAIVTRKGEVILESDILMDDDEIKIINVIHGG
jgi:sulfur carrier protein ThiS